MKKILLILLFFAVLLILACKPETSSTLDTYCHQDDECQTLWDFNSCE